MVRVSSPAKLRPWSELTAKMVMGVVPGLVNFENLEHLRILWNLLKMVGIFCVCFPHSGGLPHPWHQNILRELIAIMNFTSVTPKYSGGITCVILEDPKVFWGVFWGSERFWILCGAQEIATEEVSGQQRVLEITIFRLWGFKCGGPPPISWTWLTLWSPEVVTGRMTRRNPSKIPPDTIESFKLHALLNIFEWILFKMTYSYAFRIFILTL